MHGGHVTEDDDPEKGFDNWRKAIDAHRPQAAGADREHGRRRQRDGAPARADRRLWEAVSGAEGFDNVGFCLDTCHAHAGGNDLATVVDEVRAITGRIDLVHANDTRDVVRLRAPTGTSTSARA